MASNKDKIRLSFDISPELNNELEEIAEEVGGSKTEVFRKAIALIKVALDGKHRGLKLGLAGPDQRLATEIVGL